MGAGQSYSIATGAGYVANVAAAAAGVVMLMEAAVSQVGGGTMHVTIGTVKRQTLPHVIYGVGNNTVHAMGSTFFRMRVVAFETYLPFVPRITISGIPVWNAKAVVETGGSAWSCVSAAINAGLRGWGL